MCLLKKLVTGAQNKPWSGPSKPTRKSPDLKQKQLEFGAGVINDTNSNSEALLLSEFIKLCTGKPDTQLSEKQRQK